MPSNPSNAGSPDLTLDFDWFGSLGPEALRDERRRRALEAQREGDESRLADIKDQCSTLIGFTEYTNPRYRPGVVHYKIAEALEKVESGEIDRLLIETAPRHGKALALDTPIATPDGWTTIGDLKVGDCVFDERGRACRVTDKSDVWKDRPVYRVRTDDGDEIIADAEHEWPIRHGRVIDIKTGAHLASLSHQTDIIVQGALDLPSKRVEVCPAGRADTVCIEVDSPSHLFLAGRSMLPTHNSELASRRFPAWCLGRHPEWNIISTSATADLAGDFGRDNRNLIISESYQAVYPTRLSEDSRAKGKWNTPEGGGYYAVGVGGNIMGRGADLALIDDPFASMKDARSETIRKNVWDWYQGSLYNRLQPGGRIVVIAHRMHEDDLNGRLMMEMEAGGDIWTVLRLPAITDGQALWPEAYPLEALERIRRNTLKRNWSALYMQRPVDDEGEFFTPGKLVMVDDKQDCRTWIRAWDLAGSEDGDYSASVLMGRADDGHFCIADVERFHGLPNEVERRIRDTANADGRQVKIAIPQDPAQAGKWQANYLTKMLAGFSTVFYPVGRSDGDKQTRAESWAAQVNVGNVSMLRGDWNTAFIAEMRAFPNGRNDDQIDAGSLAFNTLMEKRGPMKIHPDMLRLAKMPSHSQLRNRLSP